MSTLLSPLVLGLVLLSAPNTRGVEAKDPAPVNTRLGGAVIGVSEPWVVAAVSEGMAGADLNGDGDAFDFVLHLIHADGGRTRNLRRAVFTNFVALGGRTLVYAVDEGRQGGQDLNADGDAQDAVTQVLDLDSQGVVDLGLAMNPNGTPTVGEDWASFLAYEADDGNRDLNGDGDRGDFVLHTHQVSTGRTTNVGLAVQHYSLGPVRQKQDGPLVAVPVSERQQRVDGTGDGDRDDTVLSVLDCRSGVVTDLGLATGDSSADPHAFAVAGPLVVVAVPEDAQGADLNGDGDTLDVVPHVYDGTTGLVTNLGRASRGALRVSPPWVAFQVSEPDEGDANGDGDADDLVAFLFHTGRGEAWSLGLATAAGDVADADDVVFELSGALLALQVDESAQGTGDLNADGDVAGDPVLHLHDAALGTTRNLKHAVRDARVQGDLVAFYVSEEHQGDADLNGDGDTRDGVLHAHDRARGVLASTRLAGRLFEGFLGGKAVFLADERDHGSDLNGDGDVGDSVLFAFDGTELVAFGLAAGGLRVGPAGLAAWTVPELFQGLTDLTGDGDARDTVVHWLAPASSASEEPSSALPR